MTDEKLPNVEEIDLRLYISGASPNSVKAIRNLRSICEKFFRGRYRLRILDIYKEPELALRDNIVAVPTLVKVSPQPLKILIGNFSSTLLVAQTIGA